MPLLVIFLLSFLIISFHFSSSSSKSNLQMLLDENEKMPSYFDLTCLCFPFAKVDRIVEG